MHRFFVPIDLVQTTEVILPTDIAHQISRVLRLKKGSEIILLDNQGDEYPCRLTEVSDSHVTAVILSKVRSAGEPQTQITLLIGLTQREKFEMILQKCTEIGATSFVPLITKRTLVQKPGDVEDKMLRWKKIIQEAAEQSHRGKLPVIFLAQKYGDALTKFASESSLKLILWEDEANLSIKQPLSAFNGNQVTLIIGPEGGLSADEVELARQAGYMPVSLGKRILRMETAAIHAAGVVLYELG